MRYENGEYVLTIFGCICKIGKNYIAHNDYEVQDQYEYVHVVDIDNNFEKAMPSSLFGSWIVEKFELNENESFKDRYPEYFI